MKWILLLGVGLLAGCSTVPSKPNSACIVDVYEIQNMERGRDYRTVVLWAKDNTRSIVVGKLGKIGEVVYLYDWRGI